MPESIERFMLGCHDLNTEMKINGTGHKTDVFTLKELPDMLLCSLLYFLLKRHALV